MTSNDEHAVNDFGASYMVGPLQILLLSWWQCC